MGRLPLLPPGPLQLLPRTLQRSPFPHSGAATAAAEAAATPPPPSPGPYMGVIAVEHRCGLRQRPKFKYTSPQRGRSGCSRGCCCALPLFPPDPSPASVLLSAAAGCGSDPRARTPARGRSGCSRGCCDAPPPHLSPPPAVHGRRSRRLPPRAAPAVQGQVLGPRRGSSVPPSCGPSVCLLLLPLPASISWFRARALRVPASGHLVLGD